MVILGRNINCHHQSASPNQCMAVYGHCGGHNGGMAIVTNESIWLSDNIQANSLEVSTYDVLDQ